MQPHPSEVLEQLDAAFLKLGRRLLEETKKWIANTPVAVKHLTGLVFTEDGFHRRDETALDYGGAAFRHVWEIFTWPEAIECAQLHFQYGLFDRPYVTDTQGMPVKKSDITFEHLQRYIIHPILLSPIMGVVDRYQSLHLSDIQLLEDYHFQRPYLTSPREVLWVVGVANLEAEFADEWRVADTFSLTPLHVSIKNRLWSGEGMYLSDHAEYSFSPSVLGKMRWALTMLEALDERDLETETITEEGQKRYRVHAAQLAAVREARLHEVRTIIAAIRLVAGGHIFAPLLFRLSAGPYHNISSNSVDFTGDYAPQRVEDPVRLTASDLGPIQATVKSLLGIDERRREAQNRKKSEKRADLSVALRRFNQAFSRESSEDKLIDLAIALEASLLAGEKVELAYKMRMRGAVLLADTRDPLESSEFLHKLYDARSSIVHDGVLLEDYCARTEYCTSRGLTAPLFVSKAEEVVREVLRRFIALLEENPDARDLKVLAADLDTDLLIRLAAGRTSQIHQG